MAKLYQTALSREPWTELQERMRERGIPFPWGGSEDDAEASSDNQEGEEREWGVPQDRLTTSVDVLAWKQQKLASMDCHKTQRQDMGWLLELPCRPAGVGPHARDVHADRLAGPGGPGRLPRDIGLGRDVSTCPTDQLASMRN